MKIIRKFIQFRRPKLIILFVTLNFITGYAQLSDITINEILAYPISTSEAPYEYIELYNPTEQNINLEGYQLQINQRSFTLPYFIISKGQYAILTSTEATEIYSKHANVIEISSWPQLHNQSATIILIHSNGTVIQEITYSDRWHTEPAKRRGGWSLEKINPTITCHLDQNWTSSTASTGGTPGSKNSVYNSNALPQLLLEIIHIGPNSITLNHLPFITLNPNSFSLSSSIGTPTRMDTTNDNNLTLYFEKEIQSNTLYQLSATATFCNDRSITGQTDIFYTETPDYNDLVINEILSNPRDGGVKFVEIYNASSKTYNLRSWFLGNRNINTHDHYIHPQEYRVLTTDRHRLQAHYPDTRSHNVIELPSLPALSTQQGQISLFYQSTLIDSLYYTKDLHQPFIKNTKGISLERQDFYMPTHLPGNFTSAATAVGGATPGYVNSKAQNLEPSDNYFKPVKRVFAPNALHSDSHLIVEYMINMQNPLCNFYIYNENGILVKRLLNNQSLATKGEIVWNGTDDYNKLCPSGIYIYTSEIYNHLGDTQQFKASIVLYRGD